ncbi:TPA: hypothetical protein G9F27_004689 [Salmonella enterica]|uniref:Uncharacterized protein n=1 Tax=Salmonella enterica TaxID=28901 RepID=A0A743SS65_SALER|nr:hypothetical protein [Salmonella enterica]
MILNDFYYFMFLSLFALSMFSFTVLFAIFIYKELGGIQLGWDPFLFFDYILFCSCLRANASALSVICVFIFGLAFNYNSNPIIKNPFIDTIWLSGVILFFIHCRFFSNLEYENKNKKIIFIRELFLNIRREPRTIFLWFARILFVILILNHSYQ